MWWISKEFSKHKYIKIFVGQGVLHARIRRQDYIDRFNKFFSFVNRVIIFTIFLWKLCRIIFNEPKFIRECTSYKSNRISLNCRKSEISSSFLKLWKSCRLVVSKRALLLLAKLEKKDWKSRKLHFHSREWRNKEQRMIRER